MARAGHRVAADLAAELLPDAVHVGPLGPAAAGLAPQATGRGRGLPVTVGAVVLEIDRRAGAVVVEGRAPRAGLTEAADVLGDRLFLDGRGIVGGGLVHVAQIDLLASRDECLR